jgi:hypothetical protein
VNLNPTPPPASTLAPAATEGAPARPRLSTGRVAGIAAIVAGGVALVVATALGVTAHNDAVAAQSGPPTGSVQTTLNSINGRTYGADALFGVGGVLASVGVALAVALQ